VWVNGLTCISCIIDEMKLSVLIITLNEEFYVGKLLDSLILQTYKNFEVILVDGKSTDKTMEVVKGYEAQLDLKIFVPEKKGISFQRNFAASKASTDNLCFFDADTVLEPDFLKKLSDYLKGHPKTDMLTSHNRPISNRLFDRLLYSTANLYLEATKHFTPGAIGTFIYCRKEAFDQVGGFDEAIECGEDFSLMKYMHKAGFNYALLKDPKILFSVRRLDKYGRWGFVKYQVPRTIYYWVKGDIKTKKLEYDVGNHIKPLE